VLRDERDNASGEKAYDADDQEGDEDTVNGHARICDLADYETEVKAMLSSNESERESRYILDTACRGAHVVKSAHVKKTVDTSTWKKLPSVQGITGDKLRRTHLDLEEATFCAGNHWRQASTYASCSGAAEQRSA
jgi:hypothetical protein